MTEVRFILKSEYSIAREIWNACFPEDAGEYGDYYFAHRTKPENVIAVFEDGIMTGCLHLLPQRITVNGEERSVGFIAGVGVLEQHRGKGCAGKLLRFAHEELCKRNAYCALLQPVNTAYYTGSGYESYSVKEQYKLTCGGGEAMLNPSAEELLRIYNAYAKHYDGMKVRSVRDMQLLMEEWSITGCTLVYTDNAYAAYYMKDGEAHTTELCGYDENLLRYIAGREGSITYEVPSGETAIGEKVGERTFTMIKRLQMGQECKKVCSLEYC